MKVAKFSFSLLVIYLLLAVSVAQGADFELVESIPVETTLDQPDIRNTPEVWLEMIEGAQERLDLAFFYVSHQKGEPLEPVIRAIEKAAQRGVSVRFISDAKFYKTYPETLEGLNRAKNIQVYILDVSKMGGGVMHAKYFIVDGEEVFLGSQNFDWRSLKHIHEIGVRIRNRQVAEALTDLFNLDWLACQRETIDKAELGVGSEAYSFPVTIIESLGDTIKCTPVMSPTGWLPDESLWDQPQIVKLIDEATSQVCLQLLTYNPVTYEGEYHYQLENALRRAAARGVKVKMILADWCKRRYIIPYLKSLSVLPNFEVKLSTIPEWSGGFVPYARVEHCKYLVVDTGKCWIGSSNWEKGYFYESRNVGVIIESRSVSETLRRIFFTSWDGPYCYPVKPEEDYAPPRIGE